VSFKIIRMQNVSVNSGLSCTWQQYW